MKLGRGANGACSASEGIPLRSPPGSPLNHHVMAEPEDFLSQFPLQLLDSLADFTVPKVDPESVHPFVGTEANRPRSLLNSLRVRCLARTRQTAHDDKSRTTMGFVCQLLPYPESEFLVVLDQREGNKSELLISTLGRNVRGITSSTHLRVLHPHSPHDI